MKKNHSILIAIIAMLNATAMFSQKCNVSKDPFSNENIVTYSWSGGTVLFELKSKTLRFEIVVNYDGELNVMVPKGSELLFKLANEETVKLATSVDAAPKSQVVQGENRVQTQYTYVMELTKQTLSSLASSKVVFFRYPDTKGSTKDMEVAKYAKKFADAINKGAECIKSNL